MKRIFLSLLAATALFSACSSDDTEKGSNGATGTLTGTITFDGLSERAAALSTAIPSTSWARNIKQVQMFLYDATGKVVFSDVIQPTTDGQKFTWTNVPAGTGYTLALVANVKSSSDNIDTYLGGLGTTLAAWDKNNVKGLKVNSQLMMDAKPIVAGSPILSNQIIGAGNKAYNAPAEVFTAYATGVNITEGSTNSLPALALKREVAMMRIRINATKPLNQTENNGKLFFNDPQADLALNTSGIVVQNLPKGLGFELGTFKGGISAPSVASSLILVASGNTTYNTAEPASGYGAGTILTSGYTLWKDILVFPNTTKADNETTAQPARKYFIKIRALAKAGYQYVEGDASKKTLADGGVNWWGTVNESFSPNKIREVNITLTSLGTPDGPDVPITPEKVGGLEITVSAPVNWDPVIDRSDIEL